MIQYMLFTISPNNKFKDNLKKLIDKYPTIDTAAIGFPLNWENESLWRH